MWTIVVLYILGLNICQATGAENSTQMYYFNLTIEESAILNISEKLRPSVNESILKVDNPVMTTVCQSVQAGIECTCKPNFRWSDKVCSSQKCCGNQTCTFDSSTHMCVSNERVEFNAFITLNGSEHSNCLKGEATEEFKQCNDKLLLEMKKVYSTLTGFDTLTINKYRIGSVIADFTMAIADKVKPQDLLQRTDQLSKSLSASLNLETTGIIHIHMPPTSPVCFSNQTIIRCTLPEDLNTPVWQLKRAGKVYDIFNGTVSMLTLKEPRLSKVPSKELESTLTIKSVSAHWAGEYTCVCHHVSGLNNMSHKASGVLDISLLPNIDITMVPAFPRCRRSSDFLSVRVHCDIASTDEEYTVTWESQHTFNEPVEEPGDVYAAKAIISCRELKTTPQLTCTFKNRCNESRSASIDVNVIYENDQFCAADGDWEDTKAEFNAILKCKNATGNRQRKCSSGPTQATWGPEVTACVNQALDRVLLTANIIDIGLGLLSENAAGVFYHLESVTNKSSTINTFANMNASVQVLSSLSQKLKDMNNQSAAHDFLESSSNLLERSLNDSWTTTGDEGSRSLAEKYLDSVEHLIQIINITQAPKKRNVEVSASNCTQGSRCENTVFNVNVVLNSLDPGVVKMAGFKELENYLPLKEPEYQPNSIVVSTTTERKQLDSVEVEINFKLLKPRPRNTQIKCVYWDNNTASWSSEGCKWKGASDEGVCTCTHLSSFAILMSRYPLAIDGLDKVTYVGLSVSIASLIINLVIEMAVWSAVVKTDTSYLRHTALVNISICLLVSDCCFLASFEESKLSEMWCKSFVVLKHFCYLSMFFWMLSLSCMLLHQTMFVFHNLSKKIYLRLSLILGYVCPLLIVTATFLTYKAGAEGVYFSRETCWLIYNGIMIGSIHTFVMPVGIIVFFNVFSMMIVILKLLNQPMNRERSNEKEKNAVITVMRSVILLTPIFGVTWGFGFAVMLLDITYGTVATLVNYAFTLLNAFQGLFILLTTCLGEKPTRDALLNCLKKKPPASTTESSTKLDSILRK